VFFALVEKGRIIGFRYTAHYSCQWVQIDFLSKSYWIFLSIYTVLFMLRVQFRNSEQYHLGLEINFVKQITKKF